MLKNNNEFFCTPKLQGPKFLSSSASLPRIYYDLKWKRKHTLKALTKDPGVSISTETITSSLSPTILPTTLPSTFEETLEIAQPNLDTPTSSAAPSTKKQKKSKKT